MTNQLIKDIKQDLRIVNAKLRQSSIILDALAGLELFELGFEVIIKIDGYNGNYPIYILEI